METKYRASVGTGAATLKNRMPAAMIVEGSMRSEKLMRSADHHALTLASDPRTRFPRGILVGGSHWLLLNPFY